MPDIASGGSLFVAPCAENAGKFVFSLALVKTR